jgi:hypothetical protein
MWRCDPTTAQTLIVLCDVQSNVNRMKASITAACVFVWFFVCFDLPASSGVATPTCGLNCIVERYSPTVERLRFAATVAHRQTSNTGETVKHIGQLLMLLMYNDLLHDVFFCFTSVTQRYTLSFGCFAVQSQNVGIAGLSKTENAKLSFSAKI